MFHFCASLNKIKKKNFETIYNTFGQVYDSLLDFKKELKELTSIKYQFLFVDNYETDNNKKFIATKSSEYIANFFLSY